MISGRKLFRRLALLLLILFLGQLALSQLPRLAPVRALLAAELTAALGRPVEAANFSLALFPSPRLQASFVTIGEAPAFGHEYFIRAESLAARLDWASLLTGHIHVTSISLSRPSFNLVQSEDGAWNLTAWTSPSSTAPPRPPGRSSPPLTRIEVAEGRINFKRGSNKSPFALIDVRGSLDRGPTGWTVSLDARPVRAAVLTQEAGLLRLRAQIATAGTAPTELRLIWQDASVADSLRLLRGFDYGVRGRMAFEATARRESPATPWSLSLVARLAEMHRWDLPPHAANPAVLLSALATWDSAASEFHLTSCTLDAARSRLELTGAVSPLANSTGDPRSPHPLNADFRLYSSGVHFDDLLAWLRSFRPNVADDVSLAGFARLDVSLRGWPPRPVDGRLTSDALGVRFGAAPDVVRLSPFLIQFRPNLISLLPVTARLFSPTPALATTPAPAAPVPAGVAELRLTGDLRLENSPRLDLSLNGQTSRIEEALAVAAAFSYAPYPDWLLSGPVSARLDWRISLGGSALPARGLTGNVELRNALLSAAFLSEPVRLDSARLELTALYRRVHLTDGRAFGARWTGSLRSARFGEPWEFILSADRLDSSRIARTLAPAGAPPAPTGLFARVAPFLNTRPAPAAAAAFPAGALSARGTLRVEQLSIAPLTLRRLHAEVSLDGRTLHLPEAEAEFYGGPARGWFRAELTADPVYRLQVQLSNTNLAALTAAFPTLRDRFSGAASAELTLSARGLTRAALLSSLEGRGSATFARPQTTLFDLPETVSAGRLRPGRSTFSTASAALTISSAAITLDPLQLSPAAASPWLASGSITFSGALNLRLTRPLGTGLLLSGSIAAPTTSSLPASQDSASSLPKAVGKQP